MPEPGPQSGRRAAGPPSVSAAPDLERVLLVTGALPSAEVAPALQTAPALQPVSTPQAAQAAEAPQAHSARQTSSPPRTPEARELDDTDPSVWTRCDRCGQLSHLSAARCPSCGRVPGSVVPPTRSEAAPGGAPGAPGTTGDEDDAPTGQMSAADLGAALYGPPARPRPAATPPRAPISRSTKHDDDARLIASLVAPLLHADRSTWPPEAARGIESSVDTGPVHLARPVPGGPPNPVQPNPVQPPGAVQQPGAVQPPGAGQATVEQTPPGPLAARADVDPGDPAVVHHAVAGAGPGSAAGASPAPVRTHNRSAGAPGVWVHARELAGRRPGVTAGAVAGLGILLLVSGALLSRSPSQGSPSPHGSASAAAAPVAVKPTQATASSTQNPEGGISYDAQNTLDGRRDTAWNSDGRHDGKGPGMSLQYTFVTPVDLRSITVLNGYQKTTQRSGKPALDLFTLNSRVRTLRVVTDGGTVTWDLADGKQPQTLTKAFGRTSSVRLEVVSVYPGSKYLDLGVSEVSFTALP